MDERSESTNAFGGFAALIHPTRAALQLFLHRSRVIKVVAKMVRRWGNELAVKGIVQLSGSLQMCRSLSALWPANHVGLGSVPEGIRTRLRHVLRRWSTWRSRVRILRSRSPWRSRGLAGAASRRRCARVSPERGSLAPTSVPGGRSRLPCCGPADQLGRAVAAVAPLTLWVTCRGLLNHNNHGHWPVFWSGQLLFLGSC